MKTPSAPRTALRPAAFAVVERLGRRAGPGPSGLSSPSQVAHPTLTVAAEHAAPVHVALDVLGALAQALGDGRGRLALRVGQQGEELLAAEPPELVLGAEAVAERARDRDERGVAARRGRSSSLTRLKWSMSIIATDSGAAVAARAADQPGEPGQHVAAVEEAR